MVDILYLLESVKELDKEMIYIMKWFNLVSLKLMDLVLDVL